MGEHSKGRHTYRRGSEAAAARVLDLIDGRAPEQDEERRRNKHPGSTKLSVRGLPYEVDSRDLREIFAEVADVCDAIVFRDERGRSKGFGLVRIAGPIDSALNLNGSECAGRRLYVRVWVE